MIIRSSGNVGIGTTAPSEILHVKSPGNNGGVRYTVFLGQNSTGYQNSFVASVQDELTDLGAGIVGTNTGSNLSFSTHPNGGSLTERMRITKTGNVGIGTTAPVTQLQVTSATNAVDVLRIGNTAGNSGSVQGFTHLAINHFDAGTFPSTRITAYQDGLFGWPGGMYFSTRLLNTDSAPLERMRISSAGNVGIGTTSPANILHITDVMRMDNVAGTEPAVQNGTPDSAYGDPENNRYLADPAIWLRINVGGTEYVIPAYTQA
jgi:hypothetical protein